MAENKLPDENHIYPETLADGAFSAIFHDLISQVVRDIFDPNKEPQKRYGFSVDVQLTPNKDRSQCAFDIVPKYKAPSKRGLSTNLFIAQAPDGRIGVSEFNPKQPFLPTFQPGETVTLSVVESDTKEEAKAK